MQYFVGGLVGALVATIFMVLVAYYMPQRRPIASAVDEALKEHWRQWDANEAARNAHLACIANAVTRWEQRYTRRKKNPEGGQ